MKTHIIVRIEWTDHRERASVLLLMTLDPGIESRLLRLADDTKVERVANTLEERINQKDLAKVENKCKALYTGMKTKCTNTPWEITGLAVSLFSVSMLGSRIMVDYKFSISFEALNARSYQTTQHKASDRSILGHHILTKVERN